MDCAIRSIVTKLNSLQMGVSSLSEMEKRIGTLRDGYSLRVRIQSEQVRCKSLTKDILLLFSHVLSDSQTHTSTHRSELTALRSTYQNACQSLQDVCSKITHKYIQLERDASLPNKSKKLQKDAQDSKDHHKEEDTAYELMRLVPVSDEELIQEQAAIVAQVEKEVIELAELFKETAQLVENQGQQITKVEETVSEARGHVEVGALDIAQASRFDSHKVGMFGAVVGGLIGGPAGFVVGMKSSSVVGMMVAGVGVGVGVWSGRTLETSRQRHAAAAAKKSAS